MRVVLLEIEFLGHVVVRAIAPHARQAQSPHPKGQMMTGKDRVRQIVEALLTGLAEVALTLGLGIIMPLFGNLRTVTRWTLDTVGPA